MKKLKQLYQDLPNWVKNKYILTGFVFAIWMLFFDSNNWLTHLELNKEIREIEDAKTHYQEEMDADREALKELSDDPDKIEKYAREKFLMKKKEEDVYIIK